MKRHLLITIYVFILWIGLSKTSYAQYKYLGYEVYDTISTNELLVPIDSSKTFGLTFGPTNFTNLCIDFSYAIYDDPLVVVHPNTFLINANSCFVTKDPVGSVFIGFYTTATHTLSQFKIDSAGTILWNVNFTLSTNYILPYYKAVSETGDYILVYKDSSYNMCMISIDQTGNILFNGILMNASVSTYIEAFDEGSKATIDSQSNLYFTSYKRTDLDTVPFNSNGEVIKTSHKIYKYNKYGNLLWTYSFPFSYPNPGLEGSAAYELNILNDTLIVSGFRVFSSCYNQSDSVFITPAIYFIDSSGLLISTYLTPNISQYGDVTIPPFYSIKYLGKGLNGNPVFFDMANYYTWDYFYLQYFIPPTIFEININTLQTGINYNLFQNLYPNLNPELVEVDNYYITYMESDPLGNLAIFHTLASFDTLVNSTLSYIPYYCIHFDASGSVVQVDTGDLNTLLSAPSLYNRLNNNGNISNTWKKTRNSNDILRWKCQQIPNSNTFFRFQEKWCFDCTPTVTGRVFEDVLYDCQDLNDPGFQSIYLSVDNGTNFVFSNNAGNYEAYLDSGPHSIEPVFNNIGYWYSGCFPLPLNVNAPVSPNVSVGNDIPINLLPNVHDIVANTSSPSNTNPGFNCISWINLMNNGTVTENGIISFTYTDSVFDFVQGTPAPDSISPGYLHWNYNNLPIFSTQYFEIEWNIPTSLTIGTPFEFSVTAGDISIDTFPLNNTEIFEDILTGSYDPNDKQVWPKGTGQEGYISPQDSLLEYLIRFQNTGTDTAITVRVEDMIDTDLDLSTLQIEMASHPYTVQLQGRKLIFTFANIMLPDSGANYAASNGFVQYTIEQKPGLPIGTEIKNIAAIYFDFNAPVITNMVTNTIDWATKIEENLPVTVENKLLVYPNPFGEKIELYWNLCADEKVISSGLYTIHGQKVVDLGSLFTISTGKTDISLATTNLNPGIYFLKTNFSSSNQTIKIVKF